MNNPRDQSLSRDEEQAITKQNKRIRSITKLSFATSRQEFLDVGEALLSVEQLPPPHANMLLSIPEALEYVTLWRIRQPRLPHAVASTAALAELLWQDQHHAVSPEFTTHAYAAAILRAVNGLADPLQQHRTTAASVAVLCESIGVPVWLVDVRHQATHQALPTLPVLRLAASSLLQIFRTVYWEPYREYMEATRDRAWDLLRAYQRASVAAATTVPAAAATSPPAQRKGMMMTAKSPIEAQMDSEEEDRAPRPTSSNNNWRDQVVPQLGSNTNRFAALMTSKKKKKREEEPKHNRKRPKPQQKTIDESTTTTATEAAAAYVRADLPLDIAYDSALDFLRERRQQRPVDDVPLVQTLCRAWPGWFQFLQQQPDDRIQDLLVLAQLVVRDTTKTKQRAGRFVHKQEEDDTTATGAAAVAEETDPEVDHQSPTPRNIWRQCTEWEPCPIGAPPLHYA